MSDEVFKPGDKVTSRYKPGDVGVVQDRVPEMSPPTDEPNLHRVLWDGTDNPLGYRGYTWERAVDLVTVVDVVDATETASVPVAPAAEVPPSTPQVLDRQPAAVPPVQEEVPAPPPQEVPQPVLGHNTG